MPRRFIALSLLMAFISYASYLASTAKADPLPGRDLLKFSQKPMVSTPITSIDANGLSVTTNYGGHDELSTAYGFSNAGAPPLDYNGPFMADDFADKLSSPVVHVKWWGSYLNAQSPQDPNMPVDKFLISFESDLPAGPAPGFSRPDQPLLNQVVTRAATLTPGSGTFTENLIRGPDPVLGESLYEYNAELHLGKDFPELKDTVYWLKVVAMVDVPAGISFPTGNPPQNVTRWGWHNRDYTLQNTDQNNNPLASANVTPGEQIVGTVGSNTPIWHFQDNAVTGDVRITPGPMGFVMPNIFQPAINMSPTHYLNLADGPAGATAGALGIAGFSKDLAFEIYALVPEPTSCLLMLVGLAVTIARRNARQT